MIRGWRSLLLAAASLFLMTCGSFPLDTDVSAEDGGDLTAVLSGYGKLASDGYLFVRLQEGSDAIGSIYLLLPTLHCSRPNCADVWLFHPDGRLLKSLGIPNGSGTVGWRLSDLIESPTLSPDDEGEYPVAARVYFTDPNGNEQSQVIRAFVRVHVVRKTYAFLGCHSAMVAWVRALSHSCEVEYSSRGRVALCGDCG